MALTFDDLKKLMTAEGMQFFVHPNDPVLMAGAAGIVGKHQLVICLYDDGAFLQLRTVNYEQCPAGHAHLAEVLRVLSRLNTSYRLVKFAWDERNGEIIAFGDHWIVDGTLTQRQLHRLLSNFLPAIDLSLYRIRTALQTGTDPGPEPPEVLIDRLLRDKSSLPKELRDLVESLPGSGKGTPADKPGDPAAKPPDIETL